MPEIHERVATLEEKMRAVEGGLVALRHELGSNRDPDSVRGRLHIVENDRSSAEVAGAALDAAARERAAAERAREERQHSRWSRRQTVLALAVGFLTALPTIVGAWATLVLLVVHHG